MSSAFESYQIFQSIKFHFTQLEFDAFQYNFKTRASKENFVNFNKHNFSYLKWANKFPNRDKLIKFYVSNIIKNPFNIWIGECSMETYNKWKGIVDSLTYKFEQDVKHLHKENNNLKDWITPPPNNIPDIMHEYKRGKISIETLTIFNLLMEFSNAIDAPDFIWKEEKLILTKYPKFLSIPSKTKFAKIITTVFTAKE